MLDDGVDQRPLLALVGDEGVPGDDLGLLQNTEELGQQQCEGGHADEEQRDQIGTASADGMPQRVAQPPGRHQQDGDDTAGDVHREHPDQRQHRDRDAPALSQRRRDQHERRDRNPVGGQVGYGGGVELDVGDRGEGRGQGRGGSGRARGAPLVCLVAQQLPGQGRGTDREQPRRHGYRADGVRGGGGGTAELGEYGGQRVKRRRVVQRLVGLGVAQLAHVRR